MTIPTEIARRMAELFAGNDEWHGTHGVPEWDEAKSKWTISATSTNPRGTARTLPGHANVDMWQQHLDGVRPLGVVPVKLDENDRTVCKWGCGDIDDYSMDVVAIVNRVEKMGYPLVPCRSKSGGLHLFLFLREWEEPSAVQTIIRDMLSSMGYADAEVFPKQTRLADGRDRGSWIVVPYFGGDFDGRLRHQRGVKPGGGDMTVEEFATAAEAARTTTAEIRVQRAPAPRRGPGTVVTINGHEFRGPSAPFGDGPPCLEHLAGAGVEPGGQNNALIMMGVYFKKSDPQNWRASLEQANHLHLRPPGSADGLLSVIRSLERREYQYTCRAEPMRSFCNSRLCRGRPHGVGEVSETPRITHILQRVVDDDSVLWLVQLQGIENRYELTTEQFLEYRKFRHKVMDRVGGVAFQMMKENDWSAIITSAMNSVMEVQDMKEVPEDLQPNNKFKRVFAIYTGSRALAARFEELAGGVGKPWQDVEGQLGRAGWWYFRLMGFEQVAHQYYKNIRWSDEYMVKMFQRLGGVNVKKKIAGREFSLWGFPPEAVQREPPRMIRDHREEKI